MKHVKILILLVLIIPFLYCMKANLYSDEEKISTLRSVHYTPHPYIYIDDNSGFEEFSGDGSKSNPYMITDLYITNDTETLIHIQDTTACFIISDNLLVGGDGNNGIVLLNIVNGSITNNTIKNCDYGISLYNSEGIVISSNTVFNNHEDGVALHNSNNSLLFENIIHSNGVNPGGNGVYLDPSNYNVFYNNTIFNNSKNGILLNNSEYNTVSNNNVSKNHEDGIALHNSNNTLLFENLIHENGVNPGGNGVYLDPSNHNFLLNNTIFNNDQNGILLNESKYNILANNNVSSNHEDGVYLHDSSFNVISNNLIHHNGENPGGNGVYLDPSNNNTINHNDIYNNTLAGVNISINSENNQIKLNNFIFNCQNFVPEDHISQAQDNGSFNIFDFNYWNDHNNTSTIVEGIADIAYDINGTAGNRDEHPKATPFTPTPATTFYNFITTTTTSTTSISSVSTTTATTTSAGAPGFTIIVLLFSIISILFHRWLKRLPKK